MRRRLKTETRLFDLDAASVYLASHLSGLDDAQTCRLAETVGRAKSTVQSWAAGRCVPPRNLWPRIGQFFGEGPSAMFDAASRTLKPPAPKHFPHQQRELADPPATARSANHAEISAGYDDEHVTLDEIAELRARIARLEQAAREPRT